MHLGFIGLGQMGRPMAERLKAAGHRLKVYNRTRSAPEIAANPQEVLDAEVVITMLADDAAVRAVWLDTGLATRLPKGAIHLNMATVSMGIARELTAIHKGAYVAAPVFGRPANGGAGTARHHRRGAEGRARSLSAALRGSGKADVRCRRRTG